MGSFKHNLNAKTSMSAYVKLSFTQKFSFVWVILSTFSIFEFNAFITSIMAGIAILFRFSFSPAGIKPPIPPGPKNFWPLASTAFKDASHDCCVTSFNVSEFNQMNETLGQRTTKMNEPPSSKCIRQYYWKATCCGMTEYQIKAILQQAITRLFIEIHNLQNQKAYNF